MPDKEGPRAVELAFDELADFGSSFPSSALPAPVVAHAPWVILDTVGAILAGSVASESSVLAKTVVGAEHGDATVLRAGLPRAAPHMAAMLNGTSAVWLELDPGHRHYRTHAPAHVLPATLATAEHIHASGEDLLAAFVVGCEIAYRVGGATRPRPEVNAHGTWAIVGAAAAVARLHRLETGTFARALRLASHLALATTFRASVDGVTVRNAFVGIAGELAMQAVWLASAGFTALDDAPAEVFGKLLGTDFSAAVLTARLGRDFEFLRDFAKVHACCHHLYAAIEALNDILRAHAIIADEIDEIVVSTYALAARFAASAPRTALAAKFSLPYVLAARITRGDVGPDHAFSLAALQDPALRALARRVVVTEDPAFSAAYPDDRPARVEVRMIGGHRHTATCTGPQGDYRSPLSADVRAAKFEGLASRVLTAASVEVLREGILRLRTLRDVAQLLDDVRRERTDYQPG